MKECVLPCPFCGALPEIGPTDPEAEGSAWGGVMCGNSECPTFHPPRALGVKVIVCEDAPEVDFAKPLPQTCIDEAIRRWNQRKTQWQPIDAAPKDGTPVYAGAELSIGHVWGIPYPTVSKFINDEWHAKFDGIWRPYEPQPTHYIPFYQEDRTCE